MMGILQETAAYNKAWEHADNYCPVNVCKYSYNIYTRNVQNIRISITWVLRVVDNPKEIMLISSTQQLKYEIQ